MLNLFRRKKEVLKKNILTGDTCRVIIEDMPKKIMPFIGKEANAYYLNGHLFITSNNNTVITSEISSIRQVDEVFHFISSTSKYTLRMIY